MLYMFLKERSHQIIPQKYQLWHNFCWETFCINFDIFACARPRSLPWDVFHPDNHSASSFDNRPIFVMESTLFFLCKNCLEWSIYSFLLMLMMVSMADHLIFIFSKYFLLQRISGQSSHLSLHDLSSQIRWLQGQASLHSSWLDGLQCLSYSRAHSGH